ncbi:MAG TPA: TIGR00159 family protein [Planctomycetes bacterium]|nr:TIGR00159 family protein [Planctomycetota bacterium]
MQTTLWVLQVLILTIGIHVFLRFVRTTRGNPLIRGLLLSILGGVVGLWWISTVLRLEELEFILEGSTGYVVIALVIVFQPELRRAIAQLGERSASRRDTDPNAEWIAKVAEAVRLLAERREGALIAFERESSLNTVIETGSSIGARVSARLLQSLFHPGGALHDGAVVLRGTQVVAAGCILPLSKGKKLPPDKGTRHRAALGLSEETDAIVVVVSEETGEISIAHRGRLSSASDPRDLEAQLSDLLGGKRRSRAARVPFALLRAAWSDLGWLAGSFLLASGAWFTAHQSIQEQRPFVVTIVDGAATGRRAPRDGEILVLAPREGVRVHTKSGNERRRILVTGSKGQLRRLGLALRGTFEIQDEGFEGGPLDLANVRWEESIAGVSYRWDRPGPPELVIERSMTKRLQVRPADLTIDASRVDPRFTVRSEAIHFDPGPDIEFVGPSRIVSQLDAEHPPRFEPVRLGPADRGEVRVRLELSEDLTEAGLRMESPAQLFAFIPVLPVERELGSIRREVALVCLVPEKSGLLDGWALPASAQTARLTVITSGLIPADAAPNSTTVVERTAAILRFVQENLRVFADVGELPESEGGRAVPIHMVWMKQWRDSPEELELPAGTLGEWERLEVRLDSQSTVLLEPLPPTEKNQ